MSTHPGRRRRTPTAAAVLVRTLLTLLTGALVLVVVTATASMSDAVVPVQSASAGPASAPAPRSFGVVEPGAPADLSGVRTLTDRLGRSPSLVTWYVAWSAGTDFPAADVAAVTATGATPEVTWEPWDPAAGLDQPAYRLSAIAAGAHDAYLQRWARQARAAKQRVVVRLGHEMNGSWYPWAEQANGNAPGDYVRAFRHVHDVFVAQRATNVVWAWSPNVSFPGSTPLAGLYPGDAYVDQVAPDGYNWSTLLPGTSWTSFGDLFAPTLAQVADLTTRPVVVGETGCTEVGGDKAAWVRDMFSTLATHPEITGVTWFDVDKETNWRIDSSTASLEAFRAGLATYR